MEFMGFHIVDIVIVALVAFLAIKGLVNGFVKELLNFITIVAGVILAARYNIFVVERINEQNLVPQIPEEFAKIIGFILIIVSIWLLVGFISSIITKLTSRPSGFFSRLIGYILSAARYLFIFSLIIYFINQSEFFAKSATKFNNETKLFQPMSEIGATILDLNQTVVSDVNTTNIKEVNIKKVNISEANTTEIKLIKKPSTILAENNSSNY